MDTTRTERGGQVGMLRRMTIADAAKGAEENPDHAERLAKAMLIHLEPGIRRMMRTAIADGIRDHLNGLLELCDKYEAEELSFIAGEWLNLLEDVRGEAGV